MGLKVYREVDDRVRCWLSIGSVSPGSLIPDCGRWLQAEAPDNLSRYLVEFIAGRG